MGKDVSEREKGIMKIFMETDTDLVLYFYSCKYLNLSTPQ